MINGNLLEEMYESVALMADKCASGESLPKNQKCSNGCIELMRTLNKIFTDMSCMEVILTNNTDNDFFGVVVTLGGLSELVVGDSILSEARANYRVEIDSKLFDPIVGMNVPEICTVILHDIDQIINSSLVDTLRIACEAVCCGLGLTEELSKLVHHNKNTDALFSYAVSEAAYRNASLCAKSDTGLVLATEYIRFNNMTENFDSAFEKIQKLRSPLDKDNTCPMLSLNWYFYWLNGSTKYDTLPVYTLKQSLAATGSVLLKRQIKLCLELLSGNIDYRYAYIEEAAKKRSLVSRIKLDGMKSLEDDLFEYSMRVKNIDDENSAILLMRQINNRIGMIDDYLMEEELSDHERKRWEKLYDKYDKLREEMIKKPIYSRKMYGLFVDYNALMQMNAANQMTLNTMY